MSDSFWLFLILSVIVAAVVRAITWFSGQVRSVGQRVEEGQRAMEHRALQLLAEFPMLSDEEVGLLLHDELVNARISDACYMRWANADTVGRMRRTAVVASVRERAGIALQVQTPTPRSRVEILRICWSCGKGQGEPGRACRACGAPIPP